MNTKVLDIYYKVIKPFLPRRIQISLRRCIAQRVEKTVGHVWPIDEKAGSKPENWRGWPNGKKFALVLTHDVERQGGVEKCLKLTDPEKKYGLRSSFNFVPYGYLVPQELRKQLTDEGFEVGVHGLIHYGNMFSDRVQFESQAVQINKTLKEWGSVGFRAPSMFHNLEWILDLDIEYDLSTFDTDPFEAQPDGVRTIFPFFVNGNDTRPGYIELPYTLVQDFTLFIVLRNKNIDVWKKKLDWIADQGGMALVNVHPDYINFDGKPETIDEYPVKLYTDLLEYLRSKYAGQYWHVLPREMARFWRNSLSYETKGDSR